MRGKNLLFYHKIAGALQLDKVKNIDIKAIKKACTPKAVRQIHEAITEIWPDSNDLIRILLQESKSTSGIYIGHYEPISILRGVTRHSLYYEKIILIDPFTDPRIVREQYNPILHPDTYIENTLRDIRLWFYLYD